MNQLAHQFTLGYQADLNYPAGFFLWLKKNQKIYNEFEKQALRMASLGRKRYSAKTIFEVIRWHTDLQDTDGQFNLNNNYTSGCARLFMEQHGDKYPEFFRLRDHLGRDQMI